MVSVLLLNGCIDNAISLKIISQPSTAVVLLPHINPTWRESVMAKKNRSAPIFVSIEKKWNFKYFQISIVNVLPNWVVEFVKYAKLYVSQYENKRKPPNQRQDQSNNLNLHESQNSIYSPRFHNHPLQHWQNHWKGQTLGQTFINGRQWKLERDLLEVIAKNIGWYKDIHEKWILDHH